MNALEIEQLKQKKLSQYYPVKGYGGSVKSVDFNKRTVQFIGNTYYYMDSDNDVLIKGCAQRTISDRGPQSNASAKIKHLADHQMSTNKMVGLPKVIEETDYKGNYVIYCESEIFETPSGDDHLVKYQTGGYDQHSIGFRYVDVEYAEKDSENSDAKEYWDEYYSKLINKDRADKYGYFWLIKEIELFEISVVTFGANNLTGVVGVKSQDKSVKLNSCFSRLDHLQKTLENTVKTGKANKSDLKDLDIQIRQVKQIISELMQSPQEDIQKQKNDSSKQQKDIDYDFLLANLNLNN